MRVWICQNCIKAGVVCEVTTSESSKRPEGCPYQLSDSDWYDAREGWFS